MRGSFMWSGSVYHSLTAAAPAPPLLAAPSASLHPQLAGGGAGVGSSNAFRAAVVRARRVEDRVDPPHAARAAHERDEAAHVRVAHLLAGELHAWSSQE